MSISYSQIENLFSVCEENVVVFDDSNAEKDEIDPEKEEIDKFFNIINSTLLKKPTPSFESFFPILQTKLLVSFSNRPFSPPDFN